MTPDLFTYLSDRSLITANLKIRPLMPFVLILSCVTVRIIVQWHAINFYM